jgi:hypothetical protein
MNFEHMNMTMLHVAGSLCLFYIVAVGLYSSPLLIDTKLKVVPYKQLRSSLFIR